MELYTTATLWKNYNRRAEPLETTVVSVDQSLTMTTKCVYFNGDPTSDGCPRIFARYMISSNSNGCGVVLMNDVSNVFDPTFSDMLVECGYNVLVVDYAGKRDDDLHTIYPFSLDKANYTVHPETVRELPDNPKQSCWYVWATLMMRGITFLEQQPEITTGKINVVGVKTGAFQVWKVAYLCPELACGVALFNSGYMGDLKFDGLKEMQYDTCIDNVPYARETTLPVLIQVASNADDESLEYMSNLYLSIKSDKCVFSVGERRNKLLNAAQLDNIHIFLDYYNLGKSSLPELPYITVRQSEHNLYYDMKVDLSLPLESVELYVSQGNMEFSHRNWHKQAITPVSDGAYIAKVDVYVPKQEVCAFLTVKYKNTLALSSELITKVPFLMKVRPAPIKKSHLLYTAADGVDDWTVLGHGDAMHLDSPVIEQGLHGIDGLTSNSCELSTFKFGEDRYKLEKQTMMQVSIYFESDTDVTFTVECPRTDGNYAKYYYSQHVKAYKEWLKINLAADSFRGEHGRLENFDEVSCLTIRSEKKILLNSVIWV